MIRAKALLFLLLTVTPLLLRFSIMTNYLVQYNYYAEVLCENQDKPEMECNGKCALMQELDKAEDGNSDQAPSFPNLKTLEVPAVLPNDLVTFSTYQNLNISLFKPLFEELPIMAIQVEEQPPTFLLS
jgi:hypothetical protein